MNNSSSKESLSEVQRAARNGALIGYALQTLRGLADKLFLLLAACIGASYFDFSTIGLYWQLACLLPAILLIQLGRELCMAPFSFIDHQRVGALYVRNYTWRVWWRSVRKNSFRRLMLSAFIVAATYLILLSPAPFVLVLFSPFIVMMAYQILPWEKSIIEPRDVSHVPCTDQALLARIEPMLKEVGLSAEAVKIAKLSDKFSMANAWKCGEEVWLGDTLLAKCSDDGVDSVVGHEIGHYYHRHSDDTSWWVHVHIWLALMVGFVTLLYSYPMFDSFDNWLVSVPVFLFAYELTRTVLKRAELAISRRHEREADEYALNKVGSKGARDLRDALCDVNHHWQNPWPILVWLFSTHPSTAQRNAHVDEWERRPQTRRRLEFAPAGLASAAAIAAPVCPEIARVACHASKRDSVSGAPAETGTEYGERKMSVKE